MSVEDARAERAILDRAEAYRLVTECQDMRRLAEQAEAEVARLRAALEQSYICLSNALEIGRIECLCRGADGCDPHEWLYEIEQALSPESRTS